MWYAHFMVAKNFAALSGASPSPVDDATNTTTGVLSTDRPSHPSSLHDITCKQWLSPDEREGPGCNDTLRVRGS